MVLHVFTGPFKTGHT